MTFHDFFHDLFKFSTTLGLNVILESFQNFLVLPRLLNLNFNRNKLSYPPKCVLFALFNYSSLSHIVNVLSYAVTDLPNKSLIFHDFQGPKIEFHDFPGHENEILKFQDFPGFPRSVRTL